MESGTPVVFYAPDFYKERKIGVVLKPCPDHDDAYLCIILDENAPLKKVCVKNNREGDTLVAVGDL